jgi:flagellar biosynthetic protein FlhB
MTAEQDADLTESATPYKLEQARKEGSVAKSMDLVSAAILGALIVSIYASGSTALKQSLKLHRDILSRASQLNWSADEVSVWIGHLLIDALHILAPLFLSVAIAAIMISLVQVGPVFSAKPLSPNFDRINPASGFKRLFSLRILYEAFKSVLKLAVLVTVGYFAIFDVVPGVIALAETEPKGYVTQLIDRASGVLVKLTFALFLIAAMDFAYTRWEFAKRMRMSRRDLRDESKNREGDPRLRARLRELRMEMLKRSQSMRNVSKADVLITNPTHVAVALSYEHGTVGAPKLIAKGAGEAAHKMRKVAGRHHIPIVQNKALARALYKEVDYNGFVPEKMYAEIAKIMVWVYTMREHRLASGRAV